MFICTPRIRINAIADPIPGQAAIIFLWGQSNRRGNVPPNTASYVGPAPANAKFWNNGGFQPIIPGQTGGYRSEQNPSIHLILEFEAVYPDIELFVVETYQGGSSFSAGGWAPGGTLRTKFFNDAVNALNFLSNRDLWILPVFQNQGESDGNNVGEATAYQAALSDFYNEAAIKIDPNVKSVITLLSLGTGIAEKYLIRATQASIGDRFVYPDDLPRGIESGQTVPGLHYTYDSYTELGKREFYASETIPAIFRAAQA